MRKRARSIANKQFLHRIETYVPPYSAEQAGIGKLLGSWSGDAAAARVIRHVLNRSGIDRRHSVLPDFTEPERAELFRSAADGGLIAPTTQERMRAFNRHAGPIAVELARALTDGRQGFDASDVTHVITVSCTGFGNPGPDWRIVSELGMAGSVERYNLGFMGCYAALPGLRMARQFCAANPEAVVLVVCVELCTLHMQMRTDADTIIGNALFSDGAAGALVSAREPGDYAALALEDFMSAIAPEGEGDMAWQIGNEGFDLRLSSYVPDLVGANVERIVGEFLEPRNLAREDVDLWAVHPGGKAVLDKAQGSLGLRDEQIEASREVLRRFGNMSSATVLFVLKELMSGSDAERARIGAMAFGPGLTIESALMELIPAGRGSDLQMREAEAMAAI